MTKTAKKKCLVIVGNLAAGKSSVCQLFVARFEEFTHLSLDTWRHVALGVGQAREQAAQSAALNLVSDEHPNIIFETVGTGRFFDKAIRLLLSRGYEIQMVHLVCDADTCLRRFYQRAYDGYQLPPYPYAFKPQEAVRFIASAHRELVFKRVFDMEELTPQNVVDSLIHI